jgi:hypothetical protein
LRRTAWFGAVGVLVIGCLGLRACSAVDVEPPNAPAGGTVMATANPAIGSVSASPTPVPDAARVDASAVTAIGAAAASPSPPFRTRLHVVDELGAPVTKMRVSIARAHVPDAELLQSPTSTLENSDGRFKVFTDDAAPWRLHLDATGFLPMYVGQADAREDAPELEVKLTRPALIHGITTAPDGSPIAEIELVCRDVTDSGRVVRTTSGSRGAFQITPRQPGLFVVSVDGASERYAVRCDTGSPVELRVPVPAATTVEVAVTALGGPLAGAICTLKTRTSERSGTTDAMGQVRWQCVPRGDHRLEVRPHFAGPIRVAQRDPVLSPYAPEFSARTIAVDTRDTTRTTFTVTVELQLTRR